MTERGWRVFFFLAAHPNASYRQVARALDLPVSTAGFWMRRRPRAA